MRSQLSSVDERGKRAARALRILLDDAGASGGHLFLFDQGGLFVAASSETAPLETLTVLAQRYVDAELRPSAPDVETVADLLDTSASSTASSLIPTSDAGLSPLLVSHLDGGRLNAVGVLLLGRGATQRAPRSEVLRAVSFSLALAGDSAPRFVDG